MRRGSWVAVAAMIWLAGCAPIESEVEFVSPAPDEVTTSASFVINVGFDHAMNVETISSATFIVTGSDSGTQTGGTFAFFEDDSRVEYTPATPFTEGEFVTVQLTDGIESRSDKDLDPFTWTFQVQLPVVVEPDPLLVTSLTPEIESNAGPLTGTLTLGLSAAYDPATVLDGVVTVEGARSGQREVTFDSLIALPGMAIPFTVDRPFLAGERVTVAVSPDLRGFNGELALPTAVQFTARNNGTLWPSASLETGTGLVGGALLFLDLDGDGFEEFVTVAADGTVTAQDVDVSGPTTSTSWNLGENILDADVGDFNGDGLADVVALAADGASLFLLEGSPSAALVFDAPQQITLDRLASGLAAAHLDPDGWIDLLLFDATGIAAAWGDTMTPLATQLTLPAIAPISTPAVGDFDGDGLPDVAAAVPNGDVEILIGTENRTFGFAVALVPTSPATGVVAVSLDGDDLVDLVATAGEGLMGTAFLPTGAMNFDALALFADAAGTGAIAADWNGDGQADLLAPVAGTSGLRIALGDGSGNVALPTTSTANDNIDTLRFGDLNGDGVLDLAMVFTDGSWEVALGDAANPPLSNRLHFDAIADADAGDTGISYTVLADAEVDLEGYTVVFRFDPAVVQLDSLTTVGTAAGALTPDFEGPNIDNATGVATLGVIFEFIPSATPQVLNPGSNQSVATGTLSIDAGAATQVTELTLENGIGTPANDNNYVNGGQTILPTLGDAGSISVTAAVVTPTDSDFIRGDANFDGVVNVADGSFLQDYVGGAGGAAPPCFDAADANDDGALNISDVVVIYDYLFSGGSEPPPPFPLTGSDPTTDSLDCSP